MKTRLLTKNAIRCKKCGEVIESKYTHDFVTCSCGACSVDGGLSYLRRCGSLEDYEELSESKEVDVTPKYKVGDKVYFQYLFSVLEGKIIEVDVYPNSKTVFYSIRNEETDRLYEHILEKDIQES